LLHYSFECAHITRFLQNTNSLLTHLPTRSFFTNTTSINILIFISNGHKGPVLRPRCIGPGRARTQILFFIFNNFSNFLFLLYYLQWGLSCQTYSSFDTKFQINTFQYFLNYVTAEEFKTFLCVKSSFTHNHLLHANTSLCIFCCF